MSLRGGAADEAIYSKQQLTDCFAALAMTLGEFSHSLGHHFLIRRAVFILEPGFACLLFDCVVELLIQ
jgi:hypothetical protein